MKSLIANTLFIGIALATVGCTATKDEMTKQIDEVKREITTLRAANATLKDRIDMLEAAPKAVKTVSEDGSEEVGAGDRPALEVVHLSPEEAPREANTVVAEPIDDSPPIVIRGDDQGVEEVDAEDSEPKAKSKPRYPKIRYPKARQPKRGN